jgi:L-threonylcarbamoyladenylate synthase
LQTEVVGAEEGAAVERAATLLRSGQVVALPTETVYGLAADALNAEAVATIFQVKQRPRFDPLIVHLPERDWLEQVAGVGKEERRLVEQLVNEFWPGPFTIVLPKRSIVPEIVTAGLETVAVRMSSHPVFSAIVRAIASPLAAPSANRFGKISPTTAQHVRDEFEGRIPLIVDAGATTHGLESTIVAVCRDRIDILRSGPVTQEQLDKFGKTNVVVHGGKVTAPGQMPSHYAPKTPLRLIANAKEFSPPDDQQVGLLAWNPGESQKKFAAARVLSERQDLREAAANLFRYLRELDGLELDLIVAERVPDEGLGVAIMDRLRRAASVP